MRLLLLILFALLLNGCSFYQARGPSYGPSLADLEDAEIPDDPMPVPQVTLDVIEDSYRSALQVANDPDTRHRILIRLADIEMARSENRQLEATEQGEYFKDAITMYEELVQLNQGRESEDGEASNERLLYQLSKAYALGGELRKSNEVLDELVVGFPDSGFAAEAEFRRAEQAFSDGNYALAEQLYGEVVVKGKGTPFQMNAVYMQGWSKFKRGHYREAIASFTEVLDNTLIEGKTLEDLSNSQRNLVADTLRVCSISFSYLDGAESINEIYADTSENGIGGPRHYQYMLYMNLGDLYLEKKRYRDSADTYRHYVKLFPTTDQAPSFSSKAIEVYNLGNFPSLILPAKEEYVRTYGIHSEFWAIRDDNARNIIRPTLKIYLEELSSYYHAKAQALEESKEEGNKSTENPVTVYLTAAELYQQYVLTFPKDARAAEMNFLMGEAYYSAGKLDTAVDAYEAVAYNYLDKKRGAEAGYAAILTMQQIMKTAAPEQLDYWKKRHITSGISFADYYPDHKEAPAVLTKAAQDIFEQGDIPRAAIIATRMTEWQPPPERGLLKTSWLILAHSKFDLKEYGAAEASYRKVLTFMDAKDPDREQVVERIAASMYRSAESQIATGDKEGAIPRLLAIRDISPGSEAAISGQFDAANYMIELKQWNQAELTLLDFKKRYPGNSLVANIPAKLAVIYQESEQWGKAANVLEDMAANSSDPDMRRQSKYLSAELYEKSGRTDDAIEQYEDYATNFPEPFDIATEARNKLVELYGKAGDTSKRNYWLQKLIDEDKRAGTNSTARSRYLAASASIKFANDEFSRYSAIKLTLPLKASLKKKKSALDKTLGSYKNVLNYGVAEFSTEANHRIGTIYAQLSKDLMNSQRPKGLDDLALEQYEILLEEQAYPFEEKAIDLLATNSERSRDGIYDDWVKRSFEELGKLLPARYGKKENKIEVSDDIY